MKGILAIWFFFMLGLTLSAQVNDEEAIRKSFDSYLSAIRQARGEEAANQVDSRTIRYYHDIIELARNADSLKVQSLPLMDKIMVLLVRHRVPKEEILKLDGKALFAYSVDKGMVDAHSPANVKLGTIAIEKDSAKAQMVVLGVEYPQPINFYKEEGQWRYDLTSSFSVGMPALQKYADEFGEKLMIDMMLHADKQKTPSPYLWRPVREQ